MVLWLNGNSLTGSIPSCLASSFPFLESMLLYNNDLSGPLPTEWALPSLISVMLSNNPKLTGSLSTSFFLQQSTFNVTENSIKLNDVLRAVVIEGTSIGGTLPTALCSLPELVTLALSGNEITGSLPDCIASLAKLNSLRVSNNYLTGTLPVAINNMTSLAVLDLSTNLIQGRVPSGLDDISRNLDTMQLRLNRLSCGLPASVLDWQASGTNVSFDLLDGNLFGCGNGIFSAFIALSTQGAVGLLIANKQAFDAYSCGNSNYVLPVITPAILAVPVLVWLVSLYCRGRLALRWRVTLEWLLVNPSTLINELDHTDQQVRALALGVMASAAVAGSVSLVLSLTVAKSAFECEYMAAPTLANNGGSNRCALSTGIGAAVCIGLVLSLVPWWRRLVSKCSRSSDDHGGNMVEINRALYPIESEAEAWDFDAERKKAEATHQKPAESSSKAMVRVLKLAVLILALVFFTVGLNVGYVLVVLSNLTHQQKLASEMAVTLAKTAIGTLLVPRVERKAVDLLVLNHALTFVRFRLRMGIATVLSATTMVLFPVSIVLVTDNRCLYYAFKPQAAVDTDVPILTCLVSAEATGQCDVYGTSEVSSTFTPSLPRCGASRSRAPGWYGNNHCPLACAMVLSECRNFHSGTYRPCTFPCGDMEPVACTLGCRCATFQLFP
jgi:hypothetical protein